jgi:hypothetical protein
MAARGTQARTGIDLRCRDSVGPAWPGRPGRVLLPVHAGSMPGTRRAGTRYIAGRMPGISAVDARSMGAGWMGLRSCPPAHLESCMDHHATPPAAMGTATGRYPAGPLDALDAVDAAFRLLTAGPRPLAVHASRLAEGLPDRHDPPAGPEGRHAGCERRRRYRCAPGYARTRRGPAPGSRPPSPLSSARSLRSRRSAAEARRRRGRRTRSPTHPRRSGRPHATPLGQPTSASCPRTGRASASAA